MRLETVSSPQPGAGRVIAVMQPYFLPYLGYFRLIAATDVFVIFDDVQFPRRGRVHRSELDDGRWLTLPLARQSRDTLIRDLEFAPAARAVLDQRLGRLSWLGAAKGPLAERVRSYLYGELGSPLAFVEAGLALVTGVLGLPSCFVRSSSLGLDRELRGQARVLAIVQGLGGDAYLNPPGGRALYDRDVFQRSRVELRFLPPYEGPFRHLLRALVETEPETLIRSLQEDRRYLPA